MLIQSSFTQYNTLFLFHKISTRWMGSYMVEVHRIGEQRREELNYNFHLNYKYIHTLEY